MQRRESSVKTQSNTTCNTVSFFRTQFRILSLSSEKETQAYQMLPWQAERTDSRGRGRGQALSQEDLCLDNEKHKEKGKKWGWGEGRNWKAVMRILKGNLMKSLQINLWNAQGKPKRVKDSFKSREDSGLLALTISF